MEAIFFPSLPPAGIIGTLLMKRVPLFLFAILMLAGLSYVWFSAGGLPEKVAAHFNSSGSADGWMERARYLRFILLLCALMPLGLVGAFALLGLLPVRTFNIPKKEIWSHPSLREPLRRILVSSGLAFGSANLCFLLTVHALTLQANAVAPPRLNGSLLGLVSCVYILFNLIIILILILRLLKPPVALLNTTQVED